MEDLQKQQEDAATHGAEDTQAQNSATGTASSSHYRPTLSCEPSASPAADAGPRLGKVKDLVKESEEKKGFKKDEEKFLGFVQAA